MLDDTAALVTAWRPRAYPDEAVGFARSAVSSCGPLGACRARTLLWSCASLARFSIGVGLDPVPEVLFRPSSIERFVIVGLAGASPGRRRDIRTNLRFVARRVVPGLCEPAPVGLPRSRAKAPYSPGEIAAYLALADAQPSLPRRMRLQALICAGAGAGLNGADLRDLRGDDVSPLGGGLVVIVRGRPQGRSRFSAPTTNASVNRPPSPEVASSPVASHLCAGTSPTASSPRSRAVVTLTAWSCHGSAPPGFSSVRSGSASRGCSRLQGSASPSTCATSWRAWPFRTTTSWSPCSAE